MNSYKNKNVKSLCQKLWRGSSFAKMWTLLWWCHMCLAEKMFLGGQFVAFFLCHLILKLNLGTAVQKYLRHLNKKYFIKMLRPILFCFYKMIFFKVAQYIFLLSLEKVFFFFLHFCDDSQWPKWKIWLGFVFFLCDFKSSMWKQFRKNGHKKF